MAEVLQLANEDGGLPVNLLTGGLNLKEGTWQTQTAPAVGALRNVPFGVQYDFGHYAPVTETMDLIAKNAPTKLSLREGLRYITTKLAQARRWHEGGLSEKSVWLEWNSDGEDPKRALVLSGVTEIKAGNYLNPMLSGNSMLVRLSLVRHPFWEDTTLTTATYSTKSTLGGSGSVASNPGDEPGRIASLSVVGVSCSSLYRFWVGLRQRNQGYSHFQSVWECELGTNGTDAADAADATASGGSKVQVSFATTATLAKRLDITVQQVCAAAGHTDYNHHQGRYLVLGRVKVSAGTIGLQLRAGYTTEGQVCEEVYLDNTSWRLMPLGQIQIPPFAGNDYAASDYYQNFCAMLYAERVSGAGVLDLDCLVLIPSDHLLTIEGANLSSGAGGQTVYAKVRENDVLYGYGYRASTTVMDDTLDVGGTDFYVPTGDGILVVAAEGQTAHALSETVTVAMSYYRRWLEYRIT